MKFTDILTENKKENIYVAVEKQQRKGKTDKKWRADEETGEWKLYDNSKLGYWYLLSTFKIL